MLCESLCVDVIVLMWGCDSEAALKAVLPEGLASGIEDEFKESWRPALLVRKSFLALRDNFRRIADPPMFPSDNKGMIFVHPIFFFIYVDFLSIRIVISSMSSSYVFPCHLVLFWIL